MGKPLIGISFRVGRRTFDEAVDAFDSFQSILKVMQKYFGDLTRPFDEISGKLIPRIKARFDDDSFSKPPYRESSNARSRFTRAARTSRGIDPDGSTLKQTGRLKGAVERKSSPTKDASGGQREVNRLVIGVNAGRAPYYKEQILGGVWEVPIRIGTRGGRHFDPDRLENAAMSSERYWGPKRWAQYSSLPEGTARVNIPPTNIFALSSDDDAMIGDILSRWFNEVINSPDFKGALL